ncbi:hypothetical protein [uncultured Tenacibaculum sp.]|uniref:hypothetical protein n=1 Tax=uncultured Tenacibaculum sp. TaxID=174713 RepID=UPI0026373CB6|nr:hypothetical protein [uncultured Tenacibaculum sp.]
MGIKKIIIGACQAFILFLIGVYIESIASKELLLTKGLLDDGLRKYILDSPKTILAILGGINIILYVLSHGLKESKEIRNMYNNICQLLFDQFITPDTTLSNSKYRVSFFKAKKGFMFRQEKYFLPEFRTYLRNVGRYQTRQEMKLSRVKFLPDEGVVGSCYKIGEIIQERIPKNTTSDIIKYCNIQKNRLSLPLHKAKKLNDKSISYLACPIKYFGSEDLYGVIIIDSLDNNGLDNVDFRKIEDVVSNYSVFFNSNSK